MPGNPKGACCAALPQPPLASDASTAYISQASTSLSTSSRFSTACRWSAHITLLGVEKCSGSPAALAATHVPAGLGNEGQPGKASSPMHLGRCSGGGTPPVACRPPAAVPGHRADGQRAPLRALHPGGGLLPPRPLIESAWRHVYSVATHSRARHDTCSVAAGRHTGRLNPSSSPCSYKELVVL